MALIQGPRAVQNISIRTAMDAGQPKPQFSAQARLFATPELLEYILTFLLDDLLRINDQEDPRSIRTHHNAKVLMHLLHCTEVSRDWQQCIVGSGRLQRAIFLAPDLKTGRKWHHATQSSQIRPSSYYRFPNLWAPVLNPVLQATFPSYHLRYWHLSLETTGNKHCAYLLITRRDMPDLHRMAAESRGTTFSRMLLSQPPCTVLEGSIWEERDETKDYVGRTNELSDPMIECPEGLTLGMVHERVKKMFEQYSDVAAIKLTTI